MSTYINYNGANMFSSKEMGAMTLLHYIECCLMERDADTCVEEMIERKYECFYMNQEDGTLNHADTVIIQVIGDCEMAKIFCGTEDEITLLREDMCELYDFFKGIYNDNRVILTQQEKEDNYMHCGTPFWELPF